MPAATPAFPEASIVFDLLGTRVQVSADHAELLDPLARAIPAATEPRPDAYIELDVRLDTTLDGRIAVTAIDRERRARSFTTRPKELVESLLVHTASRSTRHAEFLGDIVAAGKHAILVHANADRTLTTRLVQDGFELVAAERAFVDRTTRAVATPPIPGRRAEPATIDMILVTRHDPDLGLPARLSRKVGADAVAAVRGAIANPTSADLEWIARFARRTSCYELTYADVDRGRELVTHEFRHARRNSR